MVIMFQTNKTEFMKSFYPWVGVTSNYIINCKDHSVKEGAIKALAGQILKEGLQKLSSLRFVQLKIFPFMYIFQDFIPHFSEPYGNSPFSFNHM